MPNSKTRKGPKSMEVLAMLRQKFARQAQFKSHRTAKAPTAANIRRAKKAMNAAAAALRKASRNTTMRGQSGPRAKRHANNTAMATRRSARIATKSAANAIKAAEKAAKEQEKMDKKIEKYLRRLAKESAERKKEEAAETRRKIEVARQEAEEAAESAERAAALAEKQANAAASARASGSPRVSLTSREKSALNSLANGLSRLTMRK